MNSNEKSLFVLGSISPTYFRTAFTTVVPKSLRIKSNCQYLFTLLGSTGTKAAHRTLMKLTPGLFQEKIVYEQKAFQSL